MKKNSGGFQGLFCKMNLKQTLAKVNLSGNKNRS
jgi:hypothetical protein